MTFHFSYPNVLPRSGVYIGCGRYAVFPPDREPAQIYEEVLDAPMTPNRNLLLRAVQLLVAERFQSQNRLFHIQDQGEYTYQGDSLDLAWLLAQIHCVRKLRYPLDKDIWCTGVLDLDRSNLHLLGVNHDAFCLKLKAFLDSANRDLLFIVPLANMNSRTMAMCERAGVTVRQLGVSPKRLLESKQKQLVAVPADGMLELVDLLFVKQRRAAVRILAGAASLSAVLIAGWFTWPYILPSTVVDNVENAAEERVAPVAEPQEAVLSPQQVIAAFEEGDFQLLKKFLPVDSTSEGVSEKDRNFRQQLQRSINVTAQIHYQLASGENGTAVLADDVVSPVLTNRDYYRLFFSVESVVEKLWLYVLQVDSKGKTTVLFPNTALDYVNPVKSKQWPVRVPDGDGYWLVLDSLAQSNIEQIDENIYIFLSPWPANDLERLFTSLAIDPTNVKAEAAVLKQLKKREGLNIPAFYFHCWTFSHGKSAL